MVRKKRCCAAGTLCLLLGAGLLMAHAAGQSRSDPNSAKSAPAPKQFAFEVVSIRPHKPGSELFNTQYVPDGYRASFTVESAIIQAYVPRLMSGWYVDHASQMVVHVPGWAAHDYYDIDARVAQADVAAWQQAWDGVVDSELLDRALQTVLKEHFKLVSHTTPVEIPCLNLVVGKHGAKLNVTVPGAVKVVAGKTSRLGKGLFIQDDGKMKFVGVSMEEFAAYLTGLNQDYPVVDKTGLTGRYDFTLPWYAFEESTAGEGSSRLDRMPIAKSGFRLKPGKESSFVIEIDHIEKPDPN